jgi:flagellar motor switch protein FliG
MASESQNQSEGAKKIALFVSMLESDTLASLLKQLNDSERLQVIETYRNFSGQLPADVPDLIGVAKSFLEMESVSGSDHFNKALEIAFGPGASMRFGSSARWAAIAEQVKPAAMAEFLGSERAHTIAVVLSQLPPQYGAGVLALLPDERRCEAVEILASGLNIGDGVADAVLIAVQESLDTIKRSGDPKQGAKQVAAMLNQVDSELANTIVERIRQRDPNCASSVENEMFHFVDLAKLDSRSLQMILAEVQPERLAVALKGTSATAKEGILAALAEQVKKIVVQETEDLGKVPGHEVRAAQREIVELAMQMARNGKIRLHPEEDLIE